MKFHFKAQSLILFFGSLLIKIPFLFAGYGREEDAWGQALYAKVVWETKIYEVSRLPGHPLYEFLLTGLWPINHSYWLFNGISALATSFCILYFFKICKELKIPNAFLLSVGFSFIPVFFVAGTYTIDYNVGLLFVLISFYQLIKGNWIVAGLLLGIATGIRISHLGFLLPWAIILFSKNQKLKPIIMMGIAAGFISLLSFTLPLLTYGTGFFDFHKPPFPGWASIIYKLSFGVWGVPLLLFFGIFKVSKLNSGFDFWKGKNHESALPKGFLMALIIIFIMQLMVFIRLPFKAEFFIPAIPFILIYFGKLFNQNASRLFAVTAVLSCFLFGFDYKNDFRGSPPTGASISFEAGGKSLYFDMLQGPAIIDHRKRLVKSKLVDDVLIWMQNQDKPAYLIAGWYWPEVELKDEKSSLVKTDYYATEQEIIEEHYNGVEIFYLPEINEANAKINAHYLADSLGKPWTPK